MKDNSGKILLALLAGASAGVIAGLLMAPDSGTATRDGLKKTASKLGKDLEKKLQEGMSKLEGMNASTLMESATSLLNKVKGEGHSGNGAASVNGNIASATTSTSSTSNPSNQM